MNRRISTWGVGATVKIALVPSRRLKTNSTWAHGGGIGALRARTQNSKYNRPPQRARRAVCIAQVTRRDVGHLVLLSPSRMRYPRIGPHTLGAPAWCGSASSLWAVAQGIQSWTPIFTRNSSPPANRSIIAGGTGYCIAKWITNLPKSLCSSPCVRAYAMAHLRGMRCHL